ncbi:MAG: exo-alpha-sialidase [Chloroflexi bacterium]|nr:exo-alpha-sialidase [Chloroflexota bacterium]
MTRDTFAAHAEPSLAVNPKNPRNLLGTAQFLTAGRETARPASFVSFNGGRAWQDNGPLPLPAGYIFGDDVSTAFTHTGTALIAAEVYRRGGGSAVVVWRSVDGGRTFGVPLSVYANADTTQNTDHPSLAADAGTRSYLYLSWSFGGRILFSRSTDDGRTFSRASAVSGHADAHPDWAVTTSGTGGAVHVVYYGGGPAPFEVVSSSDYGRRFGAPAAPAAPPEGRGTSARVSTLLGAATDPRTGAIAVARAVPSPAGNHLQILLWRSSDGGRTWSAPLTVMAGTSDHFQPQVAFDSTGAVDVTYFALARGRAREYLAQLTGNGPVHRRTIGSASFDPGKGVQGKGSTGGKGGGSAWIGDYQALAAGQGVVYPLWNDSRTGRLELYAAIVPALALRAQGAIVQETRPVGSPTIMRRQSISVSGDDRDWNAVRASSSSLPSSPRT